MTNNPIVESLITILADTYALYIKTQNYHWNVEGPNFKTLHLLFEEQYKDLANAVDTTAELIRGLGEKVPGSFDAYSKRTSIKPGNENSTFEQMLIQLYEDQLLIQNTMQNSLEIIQKAGDEVIAGFIIERLTVHRKAAWMLKSSY